MPQRFSCRFCSFASVMFAFLLVCLLQARPVLAEDADAGTLTADVETGLASLLAAVARDGGVPDPAGYGPVLDFAFRPAQETSGARPAKTAQGYGAFTRDSIKAPLSRILRYCYDPDIPVEAVYPSALRRGFWLPGSDLLKQRVALWDKLAQKGEPVILRGAEFEEITPDAFSGCYYSYKLDRLLILTRHQGRAVLISVSRQQAPSTVGRKGAIVGDDRDWEYVYSPVTGSTMSGLGWVSTYMYDSSTITVFFEESPGSGTTGYALFKWVKAGWSNLNVVKRSHILSGSNRFLSGFKQVLESDKLPPAEELATLGRTLRRTPESELRNALATYSDHLTALGQKDSVLSSSDFWKIIKDSGYANTLSRDELVSVHVKNYIKRKLGKPDIGD